MGPSQRMACVTSSGTTVGFVLLLATGCFENAVHYRINIPEARGGPTDVKSTPGPYDGYHLLGECARFGWSQYRIVLRGLGSRRITSTTFDGWSDAMVAFRARAERALGPSALLVVYEGGCHQEGYTLMAYVESFREVDAAIARLGALLRDEKLGEEMEIALFPAAREPSREAERETRMPLAQRPFFPYEASLSAGARYDGTWDRAIALHLGAISGREAEPPSTAGWFWGLGLDARAVPFAGDEPGWSVGPSLRLGRAFGVLAADVPGGGTNRGTYVYAQFGTEWSADGPLVVSSLGLTSIAAAEAIFTRYNRTGNEAYLLLVPLALVNHIEIDWELATSGPNPSRLAILVGFSL
jgi:hypothetical protein